METSQLNEKKKKDKSERESKSTDMSQLFRKYLVPRTPQQHHNIGKTKIEESQVIDNSHPRPLSLLEQKMFPALRRESEKLSTVSRANEASKPQLTIFYEGGVSVYDNVSAEKAKEVMLILGGEQEFNSKPKKGVPLARKHSLQCFIEKRSHRIMNHSPYALPCVPSSRD